MRSRIGIFAFGLALISVPPLAAQNVAYLVDNSGGQVQVVDLKLRRVTASIPSGQQATEILVMRNNRVAFVSNQGDNTVAVLDLSSNTRMATIPVGQEPGSLVSSEDGRFVYVANEGSNDVTVIDAIGLATIGSIPVDVTPVALNLSPDGRFLYVVNQDAEPTGAVSIIDTNRNQVVGTVAVGLKPVQFAISPNLATGYVVNSGSNNVSVVDLATNQVQATVDVGQEPRSVAFSTDGGILYVINHTSGSISVVNTRQNQVTASITVGSRPVAMAVTFDSKFGYVSNQGSNSLSVLNLATNANESSITTGSAPFDVQIDPNEDFLYVTNLNSQNLTVIDLNTDRVAATVPLGGVPLQFAQLNGPTLLELAPNPAPAGSRITLNGEGFLPSSVVQFTTTTPPRTLTAPITLLDSQGLRVTIPSFPGASAIVSVNNPDGNSSEQITIRIGPSGNAIFSGGVVEGAGFQRAPYPISGGSIVSVFGNFPGMVSDQAGALPLPAMVGNVRVTFNGVPAPLISASAAASQINAVAPIRLLAQSSVRVAVTAQGQTSPVETVNVAPAAPGIFLATADGAGAFVHGLRPLNAITASDPAQRGEVITLFVTGMGNTTPPPLDGQAAPTDVVSNTTARPTVTVGGRAADIVFSGLTPQFSGLYQINFVLPQTAPAANDVPVIVTAGANTSNSVKLAVR